MKAENLKQSDLDLISAFLDGELSGDEAKAVSRRIAEDAAWSAAADEMRSLDVLLGVWETPPLQRDLTSRILHEAHRRPGLPRWVQWLTPLAAAASIALAAWLFQPPVPRPTGELAAVSPADRFVVENLDLFEDLNVVALAGVETPPPAPAKPSAVSVDRQLRLKRKLMMGEDSLLATLRSNRDVWNQSSPQRRQALRERAFAFRDADRAEQQQVLQAWEDFLAMSVQQKQSFRAKAAEMEKLLKDLPAEEKQRLLNMSPTARAKELKRIADQRK